MKHLVTVSNKGELRTDAFTNIREMHQHITLCKSQNWKIVSIKRVGTKLRRTVLA